MIKLNCQICDEQITSDSFDVDDVITCPECWDVDSNDDELDSFPLYLEYDEGEL
jgi:hypothetical protein